MVVFTIFFLDPTVAGEWQRKGIGRQLVNACAEQARQRGVEWFHVDYATHLRGFYEGCGFSPSEAGLRNLVNEKA